MSKIYISGKITGTDDYMKRFNQAEQYLKNKYKCDVINPAKVNANLPKSTTHREYMSMSLCMLAMCDIIYMLNGWEDSVGALAEYQCAKSQNYTIFYEEDN